MDVWFILFVVAAVAIIAAIVVLVVRAVVEVWRDPAVTSPSRELWTVAIVLFPILGAVAWYLLSPRGLATLPLASRNN